MLDATSCKFTLDLATDMIIEEAGTKTVCGLDEEEMATSRGRG